MKFLEFILKSFGMYVCLLLILSLAGGMVINENWFDYFDQVLYLSHNKLVISMSSTFSLFYFCYLVGDYAYECRKLMKGRN